jgi:hypothetical protein
MSQNPPAPFFRKSNEAPGKQQIREATKATLPTNMQESSAIRSYRHLRHARDAWVVPMALPRAWE